MNYFDYAATTKEDENLIDIYKEVSQKYYMNNLNDKSSIELFEEVSQKINDIFKLKNNYDIIFTGTGTEANNLAILGKFKNTQNKHFITSKIEHPSVLETFKGLEKDGHEVTYITPNQYGIIEVCEVVNKIKKNTVLISIMSVNNEIGTIQPIVEMFSHIKKMNSNIITMTDGVQALGKIDIDMTNIDLITFSAHKIYGPKGIGLLIKNKKLKFEQITYGSKTHLRPGTQSLALQVCFLNVINKAVGNLLENKRKIDNNQNYLLNRLDTFDCKINGKSGVGIISITLNINALSETIAKTLYDKGVVVSTRSACSQKVNERSHVLKSIGLTDNEIDKTIRVSVSHKTTKEEIDELIQVLEEVYEEFS